MDSTILRQFLDRTPFRPITLVLGDGSKVPIKSREFAFLSPGGRTVIVYSGKRVGNEEEVKIVDTILITRIDTSARAGGVRVAREES